MPGGGHPKGHVCLRMDKMPKCPQVGPPHEPPLVRLHQNTSARVPPAAASPPGRAQESVAQGAPSTRSLL